MKKKRRGRKRKKIIIQVPERDALTVRVDFLILIINVKHTKKLDGLFILFNFICALYLIMINRRTFYGAELTYTRSHTGTHAYRDMENRV